MRRFIQTGRKPGITGNRLRRLARDRRGNIATMGALFLPAMIALLAIGVDFGSITYERRELQNVADLAAIAGASDIGKAEQLARQTVEDNNFTGYLYRSEITTGEAGTERGDLLTPLMTLLRGRYTPDPDTPPADRFVEGAGDPNAVRVILEKPAELFFGEMLRSPPILETSGIAYMRSEAAFSIGSRLARLQGGLLNELLGKLLGTELSLTAMDYNALLNTDVSLFGFMDALASELHITAGTYDEVLNANASVADLLNAAATAAGPSGTASILATIAGDADVADLDIDLSQLIDLGSLGTVAIGQGEAAMDADIGLLELVTAAAGIANGSHQVELGLTASAYGLAGLTVSLAIGEPPQESGWLSIGEEGTRIETAQTRLFIEASVGGSGLLNGIVIRIPVYVEIASAEALLANITCPYGRSDLATVDIAARPGVVDARIADLSGSLQEIGKNQYFQPATLISAPALKVTGSAHLAMGNTRFSRLRFDNRDIRNNETKTVSTYNFTSSLVGSLVGELDLNVEIIGLSLLSTSSIGSAVADSLQPVTAALDAILRSVLLAVGISVGEADVKVSGVQCQRPVLVQ